MPTATSDFALRYRKSSQGRSHLAAVEAITAQHGGGSEEGGQHIWRANETMKFYNPWATSMRLLLEREVTLTLRDRSYIGARLLQDVLLGLLTGLIFWKLNIEAVSTRFGAL